MAKTTMQIAQEVINGLWGNNEDRKRRLIQAGYDYQLVQSYVNALLNGNKIVSGETSNETTSDKRFLEVTVDLSKYDGINLIIER